MKPCLQPSMYSAKFTISWHFLNEIEMQVLTHNLVNIVNLHGEKLSAICSVFIRFTLTHQMMPGSLLLQRRTQLKPEMLRKPLYLIIVFLNILVLYLYIVEQELHSLPEYLSSQPVSSGDRVAQFLVSCVAFCRSLCPFYVDDCIISTYIWSIYLDTIFQNLWFLSGFP
jgi:hypothetical protein